MIRVRDVLPPRLLAGLLSLCAIFTLNSAVADAATTGVSLVWSDDFSGPAGEFRSVSRWTVMTGGGGWGNGELQCYTKNRRNASTNGTGQLVIAAVREPGYRCADGHTNGWTSARISTQMKFTVTHGRLEVKAKLPTGAGAWPAFWALGANLPHVGWPRSGELDVMEYTGNRPTLTTSALHVARYDGTHWFANRIAPPSTTLSSRFHVYAADWTANAVTFYRDGVVTGRVTRTEVTRYGPWPFDKPFFLVLNLAMAGTYAGPVPSSLTATQRFVVDYVRVYH